MTQTISAAADRSRFLGGSDAAAVLGVSAWHTPVELWQLKTGRAKADDSPERQKRLARGHKLEPFIRDMTIEKLRDLGHDVELLTCNERYSDRTHPFLSCEIDFELRVDGEEVNADAKSVGGRSRDKWGAEGTDQVPIDYAAQFMHGLMITGRRRTLAAALKSFDDVELYWIDRDEPTIEAMRPKLVSFWQDHVIADVPPDPKKFADVRAIFAEDNGRRIEATDEVVAWIDELRAVEQRIKDLDLRKDWLRFELAKFMGPHSVITKGPRDLISWGIEPRTSFDLQAFKREHPDWHALFTRTTRSRVLRFARSRAAAAR